MQPRWRVPAVLALLAASLAACSGSENTCTSGDALKVCAPGTVVEGIDVSYYQGTIDWTKVKASGRKFAIARVSDGTTVIDPKFTANWQGMKSVGLLRGAYQFFRPNQDPIAQANILLDALAKGGAEDTDLPAVLDVETDGGLSAGAVRTAMKAWLDYVEKKTGRKPIVYTAAFMSSVIGTGWTAYPLWVANYGTTCPTMPSDWSKWKFWQYSSTVSVPGITGNVDANQWNGTLQELIDWAKGPSPSPPPAADGGAPPSEPPIGAAPAPGTGAPPPAAATPPPLDPCGG